MAKKISPELRKQKEHTILSLYKAAYPDDIEKEIMNTDITYLGARQREDTYDADMYAAGADLGLTEDETDDLATRLIQEEALLEAYTEFRETVKRLTEKPNDPKLEKQKLICEDLIDYIGGEMELSPEKTTARAEELYKAKQEDKPSI